MRSKNSQINYGSAKWLLDSLFYRLNRHGFMDTLLVFLPPLLVFTYLIFILFYYRLVANEALVIAISAILGLAMAYLFYNCRVMISRSLAARLIDDRIAGKDRFVTLTTIDLLNCSPEFFIRLREEVTGILHRFNLKKDYPYRFKQSFYVSLAFSLLLILVFHIGLQWPRYSLSFSSTVEDLQIIARRISLFPDYKSIAEDLQLLIDRLKTQDLPSEDNNLIQELRTKIEKHMAGKGKGSGKGRDLLGQAAKALGGLEETGKNRQGGDHKFDRSWEGSGKGEEINDRGGVEGKKHLAALDGENDTSGKPSQGDGMNRKQISVAHQGMDIRKMGQSREKVAKGRARGKKQGNSGQGEKERLPRGKTPERFYKEGKEGKKGIKGSRFVIVEIPELKESSSTVEVAGGRGVLDPKVPISNISIPNSDKAEKRGEQQLVPLEYRNLIQ